MTCITTAIEIILFDPKILLIEEKFNWFWVGKTRIRILGFTGFIGCFLLEFDGFGLFELGMLGNGSCRNSFRFIKIQFSQFRKGFY